MKAILVGTLLGACTLAWAQAPSYDVESVVNASDYKAGPFAPYSVLSIFGSRLAWSPLAVSGEQIAGGALPYELNGTRVRVSGVAAPLFYVSETQVNFLMPQLEGAEDVSIQVSRDGLRGPEARVGLTDVAPALFDSPANLGYAIAQLYPDYSTVTPENPARPGSIVILYATGLGKAGPITPSHPEEIPQVAGFIDRFEDLRVTLDGVPLDRRSVFYAGVAPGWAGLYQINLQLPDSLPDDPEIRVWIGERASAGLRLAVRTPSPE